jgi:hypothetical protein
LLEKLTLGNATEDSDEFRHWLVGDIETWTSSRSNPVDLARVGLRNTQDLEIKWGVHTAGELRQGGWVGSQGKRAISILLRGRFVVSFRDTRNHEIKRDVCLSESGDYVMWDEPLEHDWRSVDDSLVLTVRWLPRATPA